MQCNVGKFRTFGHVIGAGNNLCHEKLLRNSSTGIFQEKLKQNRVCMCNSTVNSNSATEIVL